MRKLSRDEWIERANIVHNFKYDYSEVIYVGGKKKVKIICPEHGVFEQNANNHIHLGRGCPKCSTGVLLSQEEWIKKAQKTHGSFYDYSKVDFQGVKKKVIIICPFHGEFLQVAEKHFYYGCPACGGNKPLTVDDFVVRARIIHGNKFDYSLITVIEGQETRVKIICPKHGIFEQIAGNHINSFLPRGCKYCASGNTSKKEQKWLNNCGVPNDSLHRNVFVYVGGRKFCVDGIFRKEKVIYEFLGDFWHGHPKRFNPEVLNRVNKKKFSDLFIDTINRIRWFRIHGYKVISIWESKYDKNINNC